MAGEGKSFAFHLSYYEAIRGLPDDKRLAFNDAMQDYAFTGAEPDFEDQMMRMAWSLIKPNIDSSVKRSAKNAERKPDGKPKPKRSGKPDGKPYGNPSGLPESLGTERSGVEKTSLPLGREEKSSTSASGVAAAAGAAPPSAHRCPDCGGRLWKNTQGGYWECSPCCKTYDLVGDPMVLVERSQA